MKMATDESTSSPLREIFQQDERVPLNKVTRPLMTGVVHRERLFSRIDEARMRPGLWIAAPGGSGKTTLVASYLESRSLPSLWYQVDSGDTDIATFFHFMEIAVNKAMPEPGQPLLRLTPDQFLALETFARRWFETFYARLSQPCTVVFDNFQDAHGPLFHDVLYAGLDAVPPGITIIVVSREAPPARFARLQANGRIELLGWEQVRFTLEEAMEFVKARSAAGVSAETVQQLYHKTEGWIAGLLLIVEHAKLQGSELSKDGCWTTEGIFNYFAAEVLARMNQEHQAFLLATSLLPYVPVSLAESLTGYDRAGRILAELSRSNYFTSRRTAKEAIYQYHQLFQAFLQSQAEEQFGRKDVNQLRCSAAVLFAEVGDPAAAVDLYQKAGELEQAAMLICQQAPAILAQGRSGTIREWLERLPSEQRDADADLLFWYGMALMAVSPLESQHHLKRSFYLYREAGNRAGMFLAWSNAANVSFHLGEFGASEEWLATLRAMLVDDPSFPSREIEATVTMSIFNAMSLKMIDHSDILEWHERAYTLVLNDETVELNQRLMTAIHLKTYYTWEGDFARATMLFEFLHRMSLCDGLSDLTLQAIKTNEIMHCFVTARCDEGVELTHEQLQLAKNSGVYFWESHALGHGVSCALSKGDTATADRFLEQMSRQLNTSRRLDMLMYHTGLSWEKFLTGDLSGALEDLRMVIHTAIAIGFLAPEGIAYSGLAELLWELGKDEEAAVALAKGYDIANRIRSTLLEFYCLLVDSQMLFGHGEVEAGTERLGKAFLLARINGYVNKFYWRPTVMADLCARALEAGIETEYVRRLIQLRNLTDHPPTVEIEAWPWPVKLYTLGGFKMLVNEEPVRFSGKVQKKPLEMLKALVALGGTETREGQIANYLWPDADGDTARSALKITLHRLRGLLGNDRAVQVQEGRISLDQQLVWTDVRAFDQFLRSAQLKGDGGDEAEAVHLTEKALALYRGQFLDDEGDKPWLVSPRKRLKSRFVLHVVAMGNLWLQRGDHRRAIACYLRGLEVDDLAEELYQNLMECYLAAGLKGEAVDTYQRCRKCLAYQGIKPSARTTAIYKTALV